MGSYDYGKKEIVQWIHEHVLCDGSILDVGACDGKWRDLLWNYPNMDAVEAYTPNAINIWQMYDHVYNCNVIDLKYEWYDLIIFGDMLEHLTVPDAQAVLEYAAHHCKDAIISVPYMYEQDALYGNPYEVHLQPDLTPEVFAERYPQCELLLQAAPDYAYYHLTGVHK